MTHIPRITEPDGDAALRETIPPHRAPHEENADPSRRVNYVDTSPDGPGGSTHAGPDLVAVLNAEEVRATADLETAKDADGARKRFHPGVWVVSVCAFGIAYWMFASAFSYFDPMTLCSIDISTDLLKGNRETVQGAIALLKREDPAAYGTLCAYVDQVTERPCVASDWNIDPSHAGSDNPGCYIRGSKTVYLFPEKLNDDNTVQRRADALKYYAGLSRNFWVGSGRGGYATPPQPSE